MPRKIYVSEASKVWLRDNHLDVSYPDMAFHIGCCVDTLKRILVREGLQEFDGAKYQVRRNHDIPTWTRPCMVCKSEEERPKGWYLCRPCRTRAGYDEI